MRPFPLLIPRQAITKAPPFQRHRRGPRACKFVEISVPVSDTCVTRGAPNPIHPSLASAYLRVFHCVNRPLNPFWFPLPPPRTVLYTTVVHKSLRRDDDLYM